LTYQHFIHNSLHIATFLAPIFITNWTLNQNFHITTMLLFTLHNKITLIFIPVPKLGYLKLFVQTTLSDGWIQTQSNKTISLSKYTCTLLLFCHMIMCIRNSKCKGNFSSKILVLSHTVLLHKTNILHNKPSLGTSLGSCHIQW